MSKKSGSEKGRRAGQFARARRPHNADEGEEFGSMGELVRKLATEPKRVVVDGDKVTMCWAERSFRMSVERAVAGDRTELAHLMRLIKKHPEISGSFREVSVIFIRGHLVNV